MGFYLLKQNTVQQLSYILKYLLSLINEPQQTWNYLKDGDVDEAKPEYMQNNYYYPMLGVVALVIFLLKGWGSPFDIEHAMKAAVSFAAAYFLSTYLANIVLKQTCSRFMGMTPDENKLQVFIGYCLSYLMLVDLVSAWFSHFKFLAFCALYLIYIIWYASDEYFGVNEKARWRFSAIAFFEIWLSPIVIERLMSAMMK